MASDAAFGVRLQGDARGAVKALSLTRGQLDQLDREMRETAKRTKALDADFRQWAKSAFDLRGALAALGVGLSGAAIVQGIGSALSRLEDIERTSQALGTSTDAVQELNYAFSQFHLGADDVSDALNTISDRARDAIDGAKGMVDDFALLGVTVDELRGRRPDELFELMARHVAQIEDPMARAAAVVRTFGDDLGRKLLPLLIQGRGGLDKYAQAAHELGLVVDGDLVASSTDAAEAFRDVRAQIDARFVQVVADNAEELERLARALGAVATAAIQVAAALPRALDVPGLQPASIDEKIAALQAILAQSGLSAQARANAQRDLDALRAARPVQLDPIGVTAAPSTPDAAAAFRPIEGFLDAVDQAHQDKFLAVEDKLQSVAEATSNIKQLGDEMGLAFESAFETAIVNAESFGDVLQGLAKDLQRLLLRRFITQPLANALGAGISHAFSGGGTPEARALGGPVRAGAPYWVGERGPELFVPGRRGGIVPNHALGGPIINVIDQRGANAPPVQTRTRRGPDGQQIIDVMVEESFNRLLGSGRLDQSLAANTGLRRPGRF